ncbi:MAG TPA: phosphatidate cytidylyltransferase [Terriglobales bacterium]|nr:phosphatidate cytidylyltransferase [Terriglobales bacterium]
MTRVVTALLLVPVAVAVVIWAPEAIFVFLTLLVTLFALRELYDLAEAQGLAPYRWLGLVLTAVVMVLFALPSTAGIGLLFAVLAACPLAVLIRGLRKPERMATVAGDAGSTLLGVLYLGLLMGIFARLRLSGVIWILFLFAVVWLGDTAALYAGKLWGKHAMAPRVSPNKTWEGATASMVIALAVGWSFGHWFVNASWACLIVAAVMNVAAQLGDLAESLIKRGANLKDSGSILPGHGGVLDRIDAMLFAAPALWYYLAFFRP